MPLAWARRPRSPRHMVDMLTQRQISCSTFQTCQSVHAFIRGRTMVENEVLDLTSESNTKLNRFKVLWKTCDESFVKVSNTTPLHGFNWYSRTNNIYCKGVLYLFYATLTAIVQYYSIKETYSFFTSYRVGGTVEKYGRFDNHPYPNLSICHPRWFNLKLLKGICHISLFVFNMNEKLIKYFYNFEYRKKRV